MYVNLCLFTQSHEYSPCQIELMPDISYPKSIKSSVIDMNDLPTPLYFCYMFSCAYFPHLSIVSALYHFLSQSTELLIDWEIWGT